MKLTSLPIFTILVSTSTGAIILDTEDRLLGNLCFPPQEFINAPYNHDFDFDRNGEIDFSLRKIVSPFSESEGIRLIDLNLTTRFVYSPDFVSSLDEGFEVGPILSDPTKALRDINGPGSPVLAAISDRFRFGEFSGNRTSYLGFEFQAETGTHYGYLEITDQGFNGMIIESVAWESTPGKSILTGAIPEPSSSLLLGITLTAFIGGRKRAN